MATRRNLTLGIVPGASEEARRVKIMNANWIAAADGEDGRFELMIVTSDDRKHLVAPSASAVTALVALAQADTVLVWDPADRTLIAANLRGTMSWSEDAASAGDVAQFLQRHGASLDARTARDLVNQGR